MRFLANGPNIPDELLEERDNGNVVFFCGAGVSRPSGLPGFLDLANQVVAKLGTSADAKVRVLLARAEKDPDFAPPLDQVFNLLQQEYGASTIEDTVSQLLKTPNNASVEQHSIVLRLSQSAARHPQLVTTNFDLLFERADRSLVTYVPPALPDLASGQALDGLVYLHGRRGPRPARGTVRLGLVISSSDFGRAYLADGWATRFVRDLLRSYTIVLLGYSATDPPVRYLLEGLHSRGSSSSAKIFAFDQGREDEVRDRWRDRGVIALAYPRSDPAHSALWDSLRAWADRADEPADWRRSVVEMARQGPRALLAHQRGQVASLVRTALGANDFANADPPPPAEWLCVFDSLVRYDKPRAAWGDDEPFDPQAHYGLDDDPPRPPASARNVEMVGDDLISPSPLDERTDHRNRLAGVDARSGNPLPSRLFHLTRWLGNSLDDPLVAWWAAGYTALHPSLLFQIEFARITRENPFRTEWNELGR